MIVNCFDPEVEIMTSDSKIVLRTYSINQQETDKKENSHFGEYYFKRR